MTLARRVIANPRLASLPARWRCGLFGGIQFGGRRAVSRGGSHFDIFQRQLKLFDLPLDLLRAGAELLLLQPGNADLQRLNQRVEGLLRGGQPRDLIPPGRG